MKMSTADALLASARWIVCGLVFFIPIFFLPVSIDVLEVNKQTLLVIGVLSATLCWLGSMLVRRELTFRPGWADVLPVLVLVPAVLSAAFSSSPYLSFVGTASQQYLSVLTLFAFAVLFILINHALSPQDTAVRLPFALVASAVVSAGVALCSLFGISLFPFAVAQTAAFNTVGTLNALGFFLVSVVVVATCIWALHRDESTLLAKGVAGQVERGLIVVLMLLALVVLVILDYWVLWGALIVGLGVLCALALLRPKEFDEPSRLIAPFFLLAISFLFLFFLPNPFPVSAPVEVTPNHELSLEVAQASLEQSPLFGEGGGTYLFTFAQERPVALNETNFWNVRFDRGSSFALTALPAFGWVGAAGWVLMIVLAVLAALGVLAREKARGRWAFAATAFAPLATVVFGLFVYNANITLLLVLFVFLAMLSSGFARTAWSRAFRSSPRGSLFFSFGFMALAIGLLSLIFMASQRYLAEAAFAQAVRDDRAGAPAEQVIASLDRAATFNRFEDTYYRNLAHALLLQIGSLVERQDSGSQMTAAEREYVTSLTAASVNAAKRTTDLSPDNVLNWLERGVVYRELIPLISNTSEASGFARTAHERAVELEPSNPATVTELAKTYLALAESLRELTLAEDPSVSAQAQKEVQTLLTLAETTLLHVIQDLKPDYAPAHYQLALAYERQGRLDDAIGKMESVAKYNSLDVGVAFQLGLLYLRRSGEGDVGRAQSQFEHAVELAPSYSNARWFLATVYEQQGDLARATEQVAAVAALNPDNAIVQARLTRLQSGQTSSTIPENLDTLTSGIAP